MIEPGSAVVWLLDASAIIRMKTAVPANQQWRHFRDLEDLVEAGRIGFPKQVRAELAEMAHPDTPGTWAAGVFHSIAYPTDPDPRWLGVVMGCQAAKVVDPNKFREDGDPYLLAMGLELRDAGHDVCIVTEDHKDNPFRIAVTSACDILGLPWIMLADFLAAITDES